MTTDSITLFPHYHKISAQLTGLPVEVVHKILSDIQLSKLLALLCVCQNAYLDECVSSHLELRQLFPMPDLLDIKRRFTIYLRLLQFQPQHRRTIRIRLLDTDAQLLLQKSACTEDIRSDITVVTTGTLYDYAPLLPIYQEYHNEHKTGILIPHLHSWRFATTQELEYIFNALTTADNGIRRLQSEQLLNLAALVRDKHHMLRSAHDPSQEPRSDSHRLHLVAQYEHFASAVLKPWYKPPNFLFAGSLFPLIPYDRYLNLFDKTLYRWPESKHQYPPYLQTVLDGMQYSQHQGPAFTDFNVTKRDIFRAPFDVNCPWPKKEFEWLEAFIAICEYMCKMQEKWYRTSNREETVADFWRKHIELK
ncbi:hypothetical protein P691DRAFT_678389 [Macrolepiota fuliginosa MF-IS2]|uniref:F-box domain-containing protein n=1 Tax=Macrolepiota fuliginosa MF-IS2 TaxID=1400762 RepID=A0A9P5X5J3_9AGAR|nr:hypothetical protein P691DRAFT_678389 [Macrolepiota fuliginosa MF-IS2]